MGDSKQSRRERARLVGYNADGAVVYQEDISIHDYYDGEHVWDSLEDVLRLGLVQVHGKLHDPDGKLFQEFESHFAKGTGEYIGGKAVHEDGTVTRDGICEKDDG